MTSFAAPAATTLETTSAAGLAVAPSDANGAPPAGAGALLSDLVDLGTVVEGLSEAIVAAGEDNAIVYLNTAAQELLGWPSSDLRGLPLTTIVPERFRARHAEAFAKFMATGETHVGGRPMCAPALRRDGMEVPVELTFHWIEVGGHGVAVALLRDVAERIELEGPSDLSDRLVATLAESATLDDAWPRVLQALVEALDWDLAQLWLRDEASGSLHRRVSWASADSGYGAFLASRRSFAPGEGLPGRVWATGAPAWLSDIDSDPNFPRIKVAASVGLRSGFAFPIIAQRQVLGVIELFSVYRRDPNPGLTARLVALGRELGWFLDRRQAEEERLSLIDAERHARLTAEAAQRRLEQALAETAELSATLQRSLLPPQLPEISGIELASEYHPAGHGTEVGGDFYDVFRLGRDSWGIVVGDVCGKGAQAATVTAFARYTIRAAAAQVRSPAKALRLLNKAMIAEAGEDETGSFLTAVLARLRARDGRIDVTLACAGHPLPMVRRAGGAVEAVGRCGTLLGVLPAIEAYDVDVSLAAADSLVFITDGIVEARNGSEQWGESRLKEVLRSETNASPAELARAVVSAATRYQQTANSDDIAVVVVTPSRRVTGR